MKKYNWLLLFLYFGLFIAFGLIFYFKYLDRYLKSGAEPQTLETLQSTDYIYYSEGNNLFRLSPGLQTDPINPERIERVQSTGKVNSLDINKNGKLLAYEVENSFGLREIWLVELTTNDSAKIAFQGKDGLSDFSEFIRPKFSPDGSRLAFLGLGSIDQIIIDDLALDTFTRATKKFAAKLTDYTWEDDQKLIFCTSNLETNLCYEGDLETGADRQILQKDVIQIEMSNSGLIYLAKNQESENLYLLDLKNLQSKSISDLKPPKKVSRFLLDKKGQKITYGVTEQNSSDIYLVNADGSNKIQLTADGKSTMPLINSQGDEIAFEITLDGIYTIKPDKTGGKKIVNLEDSVSLLLWR